MTSIRSDEKIFFSLRAAMKSSVSMRSCAITLCVLRKADLWGLLIGMVVQAKSVINQVFTYNAVSSTFTCNMLSLY